MSVIAPLHLNRYPLGQRWGYKKIYKSNELIANIRRNKREYTALPHNTGDDMNDAVYEIADYERQEKLNRGAWRKRVSPEAKEESVCSVTGTGHYWYVTPPPVQSHYCRDCHATKSYRIHTGEKFTW